MLAAATALAGLILVFLGGVFTAYDSYDATAKHAVRSKYQRRARFGFIGFVLSLSSAGFALLSNWFTGSFCPTVAVVSLVASFAALVILALTSVLDVK